MIYKRIISSFALPYNFIFKYRLLLKIEKHILSKSCSELTLKLKSNKKFHL